MSGLAALRRSPTAELTADDAPPPPAWLHAADGAAALVFAVCSWYFAGSILPTNHRPTPGQLVALPDPPPGRLGSVFVKDPTHNQPFLADVDATVPGWLLQDLLIGQLVLLVAFAHLVRREALVVLPMYCWAVGLTELVTELIKNYVGRLRPQYYEACGWDDATHTCTWDPARMPDPALPMDEESHSFPSGHSSLTMSAGLTLTLYALGVLPTARPRHRLGQLCAMRLLTPLALLPTALAISVAASRVRDNWHFPSDVITGAVLGGTCSVAVYRRYLVMPSARPGYAKVKPDGSDAEAEEAERPYCRLS
tara:strand:- start:223 stop:1149 length:927 start_codon:yes stop_codon:yes gene_type:complete